MVSIQEFPAGYYVIFFQGDKRIGRTFRFASVEMVYEMLKRAKAPLEDISTVEYALTQRRPVMVGVNLTDEQYSRL